MVIIRTKKDVEFWTMVIRKNMIKDEDRIIEAKRAIRKYLNKPASNKILMKDYGIDGYIIRYPLPDGIGSLKEADEYFREYEYIHYRPTYYDCTGQSFTHWYKVYQAKDGRFWAYHSIGIDC